jgi:integrase
MRFRRTVYGSAADLEFPLRRAGIKIANSKRKVPLAHAVAEVPLAKVLAVDLRQWQSDLGSAGLSKASANRTLAALKAALNLAVVNRRVSRAVSQEWEEVERFRDAGQRRELFLDLAQRRALLSAAQGAVRDLLEAAMQTGCRAGELTSARRSAFDARTKALSVIGKTGARTIPLTPASVALFTRLAHDKLPAAYLLTRDDGHAWGHSDWDQLVRKAVIAAELPESTCLYTLRHSFITQALLDGMSTLEVSKIVGTSLAMIEKHYGHLVYDTVRERLAKVQII